VLLNLCRVSAEELVRELFQEVWVPPEVAEEFSRLARSRPRFHGLAVAPGGKGSHRKFRHPRFAGAVILSGKDGEDAQHYREKQVRNAIRSTTR